MKIILTLLILVSVFEKITVGITTANKTDPEQKTLLRKLKNFQQSTLKDTNFTTWNEILADVLVNKIKIFSFKKPNKDEEGVFEKKEKSDFVTNAFSQLLLFFKTFIYDKHYENRSLPVRKNSSVAVAEIEEYLNPKDEVEIIDPKYHGRLVTKVDKTAPHEETTTTKMPEKSNVTKSVKVEVNKKKESQYVPTPPYDFSINDTLIDGVLLDICPPGMINESGKCVPKNSKLIISVPYQCPQGYRKDRRGYCRPNF